MMTLPSHLTVVRNNRLTDIPIHEITMQEAIMWMNQPDNFADRNERKLALRAYITSSYSYSPSSQSTGTQSI